MHAGPFQTLIFADSICSLATAAPLVYITKPWQYASWRLVVTLLSFQAWILSIMDLPRLLIAPQRHRACLRCVSAPPDGLASTWA